MKDLQLVSQSGEIIVKCGNTCSSWAFAWNSLLSCMFTYFLWTADGLLFWVDSARSFRCFSWSERNTCLKRPWECGVLFDFSDHAIGPFSSTHQMGKLLTFQRLFFQKRTKGLSLQIIASNPHLSGRCRAATWSVQIISGWAHYGHQRIVSAR